LLAEASIVISEPSRLPGRELSRLAEFVVPRLADTCVVMLARGPDARAGGPSPRPVLWPGT